MMNVNSRIFAGLSCVLVASCASSPTTLTAPIAGATPVSAQTPNTTAPRPARGEIIFTSIGFEGLPNWNQTDVHAARQSLINSCRRILALESNAFLAPRGQYAGTKSQWVTACSAASDVNIPDVQFWTNYFAPWSIRTSGGDVGRLTSYYEPIVSASLTPTAIFTEPLFAKPDDLITLDLGVFDPNLAAKKIVGRIQNNGFVPYLTRAEITVQNTRPIAYAKIGDALTIQVQGSGRLSLPDGTQARVAHSATNGHPFRSPSQELIRRGLLPANGAGMAALMNWFENAPPHLAREVINANPRTVFFDFTEIADPNEGPKGTQGVSLIAGGSMAIDPSYHPFGVPIFISAFNGRVAVASGPFTRLAIAQDTGGAIKGAIRGDLFWGTGVRAGIDGGNVNHDTNWWVLLPKGVDPTLANPL